MSVFMHIMTTHQTGGIYTPPSRRLSFAAPANLPDVQRDVWERATGTTPQEWASHFARCAFPVAMTVVASPADRKFLVSASLSDIPADAQEVTGFAKSSLGYMSMMYDLADREAGIMGANAPSGHAQRTKFIAHMLEGFQSFAQTSRQVDKVTSMSVGAGVYTWASYGATPVTPVSLAWTLKRQWQKMCELPGAGLVVPLMTGWVDRFTAAPTAENFRSIFTQAAHEPRLTQGIKTLLLGDPRFLTDPNNRYQPSGPGQVIYAPPLNDDYCFRPQDPQFQAFLQQRLARLERN